MLAHPVKLLFYSNSLKVKLCNKNKVFSSKKNRMLSHPVKALKMK